MIFEMVFNTFFLAVSPLLALCVAGTLRFAGITFSIKSVVFASFFAMPQRCNLFVENTCIDLGSLLRRGG